MQSGATRSATSLFPLLLVGLLAGMTYWLELASQPASARADGKLRHDPDYIVSNFSVQRFGTQGELKHTLTAAEMRHYPDDDSTLVAAPDLTYHRVPPTRVTAREAQVGSKGEHIRLIDDVRMTRGGRNGGPDTTLNTAQLDIWPDDERAASQVPVVIDQGLSHVGGRALRADNRTATYVLDGKVQGTFHRKSAAAAPPVAASAVAKPQARPSVQIRKQNARPTGRTQPPARKKR